ncbi:MAG: hypothetical protein Q7J27_12235 [Syntrophales bacterium]|nr:hypothetical protein [Syntrophales bacterium]
MIRKTWVLYFSILIVIVLFGCGGIRYSQVAPNAKDFHPKKIGVIPVDVGTFEEARGVIDQIIAGVLVKKKWFSDVVAPDMINNRMQSDDELRKTVVDYLAKLKTVNFSDSDLSMKIGEAYDIDAFLIVNVDYWNYTVEGEDKVAKVGLGLKLVQAETGNIIWKAGHHVAKDYWFIKPDLPDVADALVKEMLDHMPH